MNKKLIELHQQRGRLQERIASQRASLAQQCAPLVRVSNTSSRIFNGLRVGVQYLQQHPLPVALSVLVLALLKPRRAWRWGKRGLYLWRKWQVLRSWVPTSFLRLWQLSTEEIH